MEIAISRFVCEAGCRKENQPCFVFMRSGSSVSKLDWWEDEEVRGAAGVIAICIEYKTVALSRKETGSATLPGICVKTASVGK